MARRTRHSRLAVVGFAVSVAALLPGLVQAQDGTEAGEPLPLCRDVPSGPVDGAARPGDGTPHPAGRIAYATIGRGDEVFGPVGTKLYAIDPDGSDHVLLLDCDVIRPQWSPDGSRLAFTLAFDDGSWHIATIAADGSGPHVLTSGPGIHEIPTWSADGSWLAYDSSPSQDPSDPAFSTQLWRMDADGSDQMPLWDSQTFDVEPRISADGTQIVFQRLHPDQDYASQVIVRDLATGQERALTALGFPAEHPEWAPDGRSLVVNASDWAPAAGTLYTIDVEAVEAEPSILLDPASGWGGVKPVFAPDGAQVVFVCHAAAAIGEGLCVMAADGSGRTTLIDDLEQAENHPAWGVAAAP